MFSKNKIGPAVEQRESVPGTDLQGSNAEECLRVARETRDRAIRAELLRLAEAYRGRARSVRMRTAN